MVSSAKTCEPVSVEFVVWGTTLTRNSGDLSRDNIDLYVNDIRKAFAEAADECGFPLKIEMGIPVRVDAIFFTAERSKGGMLKTTKPDHDNLIKVVNDALKGPDGVISDDDQIVVASQMKMYQRDRSGVIIRITLIQDDSDLKGPDWQKLIARFGLEPVKPFSSKTQPSIDILPTGTN